MSHDDYICSATLATNGSSLIALIGHTHSMGVTMASQYFPL